MKKILFAALLFSACKNSSNVESRFKNYMKDSVVVNFNDPKSYEFVSLQLDSVYNHQLAKNKIEEISEKIKEKESDLQANAIMMKADQLASTGTKTDIDIDIEKSIEKSIKSAIEIYNDELKLYQKDLLAPDFVNQINANLKFRGKNKMGALILSTQVLKLNLSKNKIEVIEDTE